MKSFVALMIGACSWLFAAAALGADWYVDAAAASGGDGSMAKPFATINAVLAGLQRGDTVWIAGGTYSETVNFWMLPGSSGQTTIRAMSGATPVIDGTAGSSAAGFVLQAGTPDMTFEGLTIQNSAADGIEIYQADGCQVIDCTTTGITGNAVTFYYSSDGLVSGSKLQGGVGGRRSIGTIVENNELYGCTNHEGITLYDDSQNCQYLHNVIHDNDSVNLYLDSISHSTIDGNLIYESAPGNDLVGIELSDEMYSDLPAPVNSYNTIINNVIVGHENGIQFWSGTFPASAGSGLIHDVIANNTLVNNLGAVKWDSGAHTGTIVENNIVVVAASMTPSYLLQANSTTGVSLSNNLWYAPSLTDAFLWGSGASAVDHAAWVAASGQGANDVLADPMFVGPWAAPPATNLELVMGSPAIDTGATLAAVTHDFLDAPRPYGAGYDIGAFEYGSTPDDGGAAVGPLGDAALSLEGGDGATEPPPALDGATSAAPDSGTAGAQPGAEGGAVGATSPNPKPAGCSCSIVGSTDPGGATGAFVLAAIAGLARRRRRWISGEVSTPGCDA